MRANASGSSRGSTISEFRSTFPPPRGQPPELSPATIAARGSREPRLLIVKLSSLGDVIKTLPVVHDIRRALPDARIDWVVERPCDALLALNPLIDRVIPLELRRYRKERRYIAGLAAALRDLPELRAQRYDLIVDLQGRMKSALVATLARGPVVGLAPGPTSERHYARLYQRVVRRTAVAERDAVSVNRALCAEALHYPTPTDEARYGLNATCTQAARAALPPSRLAVLIHSTSRAEKCWPEERWIALGRTLHGCGIRSVLPWGDPSEEVRARRLAESIPEAIVPRRILQLADWVGVLSAAATVVGVDTGLTHLAAACDTPTIAIFTATSASHCGILGTAPHRNLGGASQDVSTDEVVEAIGELAAQRSGRIHEGAGTASHPVDSVANAFLARWQIHPPVAE